MSVKDAVLKYHEKQLPKKGKKPRKNSKPEQKTVSQCMEWFHEHGFSMSVVDSTATFSVAANRYLRGQAAAGFPDSAGCDPLGVGCFVEFKAAGKLSTLREGQREFLKQKILKGCFAVVVDCTTRLEQLYSGWVVLGRDERIAYLLDQLPKKRKLVQDNNALF